MVFLLFDELIFFHYKNGIFYKSVAFSSAPILLE